MSVMGVVQVDQEKGALVLGGPARADDANGAFVLFGQDDQDEPPLDRSDREKPVTRSRSELRRTARGSSRLR